MLCPYFVKKRPFSKKRHYSNSHFVKKRFILSKPRCSFHFLEIFIKMPSLPCPYLVKKCQFCQTTLYYGPEKSIRCPFFPTLHEKIFAVVPIFCQKMSILKKSQCSHGHILSKKRRFSQKHCAHNRPFYKEHATLMPILCIKTSILSKTLCSHVIYFHFSMKNPCCQSAYLAKNTSILSKVPYIRGKKGKTMPFFPNISQKLSALMPILCQKTSIL